MLRPRDERGSVVLVAMMLLTLVTIGGAVFADLAVLGVAGARAQAAGDAAAHGALAVLNRQDDESLSIDVQAGRSQCAFSTGASAVHDDDPRCARAIAAAQRLASANGARLLSFSIAPDVHQLGSTPGPVGWEVLTTVALPRNLAIWPFGCDAPPPDPDGSAPSAEQTACWAVAAGAAREAA